MGEPDAIHGPRLSTPFGAGVLNAAMASGSPSISPTISPMAVLEPGLIYAFPLVASVMSLFGSVICVAAFLVCDAMQMRLLRPVLCMSVMLLIWAICGVIFFTPGLLAWTPIEGKPCEVLGGVSNFALFGAIGMYVCVTYNLLLAFILPVQAATQATCWGSCYPGCCGPATEPDRVIIRAGQLEPAIVLSIDLVISLVLGCNGCFGTAGNGDMYECWIKDSANPFWRMIAIYFPLIGAMLFALSTVGWVWAVGSRRLMPHQWKQTRKRLSIFVVFFICIWLPPTVTRMWEWLSPAPGPPLLLKVIHVTLINGAGFMNFMVWAPSKPFRIYWQRLRRCLPPMCRWLAGDVDPLNAEGASADGARSSDYESLNDAVARLQQAGFVAYRVPDELGRPTSGSDYGANDLDGPARIGGEQFAVIRPPAHAFVPPALAHDHRAGSDECMSEHSVSTIVDTPGRWGSTTERSHSVSASGSHWSPSASSRSASGNIAPFSGVPPKHADAFGHLDAML